MKLTNELIKYIEDNDYSVYLEDAENDIYDFGICSPAGQDFHFSIQTEDNENYFIENIYRYFQDFDVSQECSYWIDETGHGSNGAPYELNDLYEDMQECKNSILDLYNIVCDFYNLK